MVLSKGYMNKVKVLFWIYKKKNIIWFYGYSCSRLLSYKIYISYKLEYIMYFSFV